MTKHFAKYLKTVVMATAWAVTFLSCNKDSDNGNNNQAVNDWILDNMSLYYLWEKHLPARTDKSLSPDAYFESLLYKDDRFSWIQDNYIELINLLAGVVKEAGYDYGLRRMSNSETDVIGYITYVKPGSPAQQAGLQRGDLFRTVNGQQLTIHNYGTLTDEMGANHTLRLIKQDGESIEKTLTVVEYKENPILLDTIYTREDKKIGYLVYNFFASDNNDGTMRYDKQLNEVFGRFIEEGVNELILDLRYNSGGSLLSSITLAGMISNCTSQDLFSIEQFNDIWSPYLREAYIEEYGKAHADDYNKDYFMDSITRKNNGKKVEEVPIRHLGVERLYVLTSYRTASASELLINALNPYLNNNIILIGDVTVGKNVGSLTFYEENAVKQQTNKWGMQPIVVKIANKDGYSDYGQGFTPDVEVDELAEGSLKPLGDTEELMLKTALDHIAGAIIPTRKSLERWKNIGSSADRVKARGNIIIRQEETLLYKKKE
ncbi:MAG: hypothetical protein LBS03_01945 [Bacteroidales bacterium]|jgi:C-terminal processing protease CtpA/Prc|nr:hypothetical protein [Bacteroidales bacterium]